MTLLHTLREIQTQSDQNIPNLIVIGGGPVGVRFANELSQRKAAVRIKVFSDEGRVPYNRAKLSLLLAGQVNREGIDLAMLEGENAQFIAQSVENIDCDAQTVRDASGSVHHYDYIVFATGARAFVPNIEGTDLKGVYQFRSLENTEQLLARRVRTRHVVVVGGGLLGIETAVAMNRFNTRVSLVHQGEHLLNRQLDSDAGARLKDKLEDQGVNVYLNQGVRGINGKDDVVTHVRLRDGIQVDCDTVVLCCGSSPNMEVARDANIRVNRGIVVSDRLETSRENVFAIGECCEHQEQNYGLISPGYDQALVLVDRLLGGKAIYQGSDPESLLKVLDFPLRSFGQPVNYVRTPFDKETVFQTDEKYIKLVTSKSKLVGGIAIGDNLEFDSLVDAYQRQVNVPWYRRLALKLSGRVWPFSDQSDPTHWSEQKVVCNCQQVALGKIQAAMNEGVSSVEGLGLKVQVGITCGSCQPVLARIVAAKTGEKVSLAAEPLWKTSLGFSFLAILLLTIMVVIPGIAVSDSVQKPAFLQFLWNDKFWKQVTGFTLLGMSVVGLIVSLRKRITWVRFGKFVYWRFAHVTLGVLCMILLLVHTGMHMGANLNQWLAINFLTVLALGALTSSTIALGHRLTGGGQALLRKAWNWLHILAAWPLPALLAAHIITVYKY